MDRQSTPDDASDPRIEDTYAEAFEMPFARLIVTAVDRYWLERAAAAFCGYASSVIGCDAECGIERFVSAMETPDGRVGVALLAFATSRERLAAAVTNRTGQCLMTCPTTAVFNGLESETTFPLGGKLRYFGDGFQKSKRPGSRRFWRVPVMDGEFIVEDTVGTSKGVAGGNLIIVARTTASALIAAQAAVAAIDKLDGCITPFPGGIARSGSKVGSRYKNQIASTAEWFCPTLRGRVESRLPAEAEAALEIVIDGIDESSVRRAMAGGITAALQSPAGKDVLAVTAGNFGGRLGKCLIRLREL